MSVKIAIIGTSHISSIVMAWRQISTDFPALEPTFFAAPGKNFRRLQINTNKRFGIIDRSLFAPTEIKLLENTFGSAAIDLDEFDAVIHVGHNTLETELASLIAEFSIDGLRENPEQPLLSKDAYQYFTEALAEEAVLPENWRNWASPRLYVLPAPRVAESCSVSRSSDYAVWRALLSDAESKPVAGLFQAYADLVRDRFAAHGIQTFAVPEGILAPSGLSHAKFTKDALRLLDGHSYPSGDHKHMNADYGLIVLRNVCETVQQDFDILDEPVPQVAEEDASTA